MEMLSQDLSQEVTEPIESKPTLIPSTNSSNLIVIGQNENTTTTTTTTSDSRRGNGNKRLLNSDEENSESCRKSLKSDSNNNIQDFCVKQEITENEIMNLLEGDDITSGNGHHGNEIDQMMPPPHKRNKMNNMRDEDMMGGPGGMMEECGDSFNECEHNEMGLEHNGNGMSQIDLFGRNVEVRFLISSRVSYARFIICTSNLTLSSPKGCWCHHWKGWI